MALPPPNLSTKPAKPIKYMKDKFFDLLRFLNLLEPNGARILSLSKLFVYLMMFVVLFVVLFAIENIGAVVGSSATAVVAMLNYGLRRVEQRKTKALDNGTGD